MLQTEITLAESGMAVADVLMDADTAVLYNGRIHISNHGYARVGEQYLHRLVTGAGRGQIVDHINGNRLDCRRANLRVGTRAQNLWNRGKARHNTSGYKGVSFCKQTGRWRAEIRANRKCQKLGRFQTAEAAARAYDAAARRLHGEFVQVNFP